MKGFVFSRVEPKRVKILAEEVERGEPLLSRLVKIPYFCNGEDGFVIGRIVSFERFNPFYDDEGIAKEIRRYGNNFDMIKAIIGEKEFLILEVELVSAFSSSAKRVELSCPVDVGAQVEILRERDMDMLFHGLGDKVSYIGTFFGTSTPAPVYLQDFDMLGEGYHTLVVGQTGSGKSTLVQMILLLYAKASRKMNFIIFDTVGEFTEIFSGGRVRSFWDTFSIVELWKKIGRKEPEIYSVGRNLAFDRWEVLRTLLVDNYVFEPLDVPRSSRSNTEQGVDFLINLLKKKDFTLKSLASRLDEVIETIQDEEDKFVSSIYKAEERQESLRRRLRDRASIEEFKRKLLFIFELFSTDRRKPIKSIVYSLKDGGKTIVIDLSLMGNIEIFDAYKFRKLILKELVSQLSQVGEEAYREGKTLNTMVVLEEAHNWMPSKYSSLQEEEFYTSELSNRLVRAYRETRKFGIGWLAITTRPSALRKEIYEHSRVKFIGMGLNTGTDLDLLRETFGKDFLDTYRLFPDPSDPLSNTKKVCFMIHGPITVLSRTSPEYIEIFNSPEKFLKINGIAI